MRRIEPARITLRRNRISAPDTSFYRHGHYIQWISYNVIVGSQPANEAFGRMKALSHHSQEEGTGGRIKTVDIHD